MSVMDVVYPLAIGAASLGAAALATVGGWIGYSALVVNHRQTLPAAIDGERAEFTSERAGRLSYYVARGHGRPLVLIHSINAGASAYEMKPIFEHYRGQRPVYALDLPGFGFSDRSNREYSPRMYAEAIKDFLKVIVRGPADVIALSLGCEFAAYAAQEQPQSFHSLSLISPTGLSNKKKPARGRSEARMKRAHFWLSFPLWSQALYDLLVTLPSIKYFLGLSFEGPIDQGLIHYDYITTHQPGARHAPLYFVSGQLFTPDVRSLVYERLKTLPVLVLYDRDGFVRFDALPELLGQQSNWKAVKIAPSKGLPHYEKLADTTRALDELWQKAEADKQQ